MVPYYEADTLQRIMDNRQERLKLAQTFYVEYLKLMNHYGMLDKEHKEKWKLMMKMIEDDENAQGSDIAPKTYGPANFDHFNNRNDKIAMFKKKKEIEA